MKWSDNGQVSNMNSNNNSNCITFRTGPSTSLTTLKNIHPDQTSNEPKLYINNSLRQIHRNHVLRPHNMDNNILSNNVNIDESDFIGKTHNKIIDKQKSVINKC